MYIHPLVPQVSQSVSPQSAYLTRLRFSYARDILNTNKSKQKWMGILDISIYTATLEAATG